MLAMLERHDLPFRGPGKDFELKRHRLMDDQRMIAHPLERRGNVLEDPLPVVTDRGRFTVHETLGAVHSATVDGAQTLVPEADAEDRNLTGKVPDGFGRDASIPDRLARTR